MSLEMWPRIANSTNDVTWSSANVEGNMPIEMFPILATHDSKPTFEKEPELIDCSEVVKYFWEQQGQEYWDCREDFFTSVSPFEHAWFEAKAPKFSNSNGADLRGPGHLIDRMGWWVTRLKIPFGHQQFMPDEIPLFAAYKQSCDAQGRRILNANQITPKPLNGACPVFMQAIHCFWMRGDALRQVNATFDYLDYEGKPIAASRMTMPTIASIAEFYDAAGRTDMNLEPIGAICTRMLLPLHFTICFLHAKNTHLVTVHPSEKLNRKRQKHGRPGLVTYKELRVDQIRRVLQHAQKSNGTGFKRALHIARGHFKEYTAEAPLFGKLTGRFFVPAHVRGSKAEGEVKKTYVTKVTAPIVTK